MLPSLPACSSGRSNTDEGVGPAEKLLEAARNVARSTVIVNMRSQGWNAVMKLDPASDKGMYRSDTTKNGKRYQIELHFIGPDMWITELIGGVLPTRWLHLGRSRALAAGIPDPMPKDDPAGAIALVKAMTGIKLEKGTYNASIDPAKVRLSGLQSPASMSTGSGLLPVSATVDAENRLTSIVFSPDRAVEVTYAGFGRTIGEIKPPPAAQTVEESDQDLAALASTFRSS